VKAARFIKAELIRAREKETSRPVGAAAAGRPPALTPVKPATLSAALPGTQQAAPQLVER